MRSFFIILSLVSFFFGRAQGGEQFRTSTATILGFENDTVFKASCKKVIIILNTSNEELQIEIFQESIKDDQPRVNNIFKEMDGNIKFFSKLDKSIFEISKNSQSDNFTKGYGNLTLNGVTKRVEFDYHINGALGAITPGSKSLFTPSKLTLNMFFNPADFNLESTEKLSNPMEIEIYVGVINEQN